MATKYTVRCVTNGTSVTLAVPGRNPQVAVDRAIKSRLGRNAHVYVVSERASGTVVHTAVNAHYIPASRR